MKTSFAKNAVIMSVVSLIVRLSSMLISVRLNSLLGAQGVGIYQLVISIYVLANGLPSSGICVAVARLTAQESATGSERTVHGVLKLCVCAAALLSIFASVFLFALSGILGRLWLHDTRTIKCLKVISLAIPFMSVSNCIRGWYTARDNVTVPVCSQLSEQAARLLVCFFLLPSIAGSGIINACAGAALSDVFGEAAGCIFIVATYLLKSGSKKSAMPQKPLARLAGTAAPVTATFYLTNILRSAETAIVPSCLMAYGLSRQEALSQLGILQGMALTLLFVPASLLIAVSTLLLPKVAYFNSLGEVGAVRHYVERSLHLALSFSAPAAVLFSVYSRELSMLIYGQSALIKMVAVLAPMIPLMYAEMICSGLLKGLGEQKSLLYFAVADAVLRLALIALLVPRLGMDGMLIVMLFSNTLTPLLCAFRLRRLTRAKIIALKPLICTLCAAPALLAVKLLPCTDIFKVVIGTSVYIIIYIKMLIPDYIQRQLSAVLRACLRNCSVSRCIFCRPDRKDTQ